MDLIPVSSEMDKRRETFFRNVFGKSVGYICIAYLERDAPRTKFREEYFHYPTQMPEMLDLINKLYQGHNVWYCPQLFVGKKRNKDSVAVTTCAWADLDLCPPESLLLDPTFTIESSPGRYQALWVFDREVDPIDAEDLSQRIAYKHAEEGADRSGWDLTQLLRVPFTYNYKYVSTPAVTIVEANRNRYRIADFTEHYPKVAAFDYLAVDQPTEEDLSDLDADVLLQRNRLKLNPRIWKLFQEEPAQDWSASLWSLQMLLFEAGFGRNEVFVICRIAACNKYVRDGKSGSFLWKEVCRAEAKFIQNSNIIAPKDFVEKPLVSDEERKSIEGEDTFVERYIAWARSLGDAAVQYHQGGAFVALSSVLAGTVRLPTSFGLMQLNLWFMILADTTLTRKSTAMDIAMDLIVEVDSDAILATDGSIEGLLTTLATRPGQPSVFLRDEFSGLLEQMTKRDYYAGMAEMLTKMYDGKLQKRVLRKEIIEVKSPILIVFAGGIKKKITSLLSFEQVSSGFMPRFIFITAESDVTKIKPLGPPTGFTTNNREAILDELRDMAKHYRTTQTVRIEKLNVDVTEQRHWDAELTEDAWVRYNQLEAQLLDAGMAFDRPEIMTPTYDRLSKSILKCAVLLAASRQRAEKVLVETKDIIRAATYAESWRMFAREVMNAVGKSSAEHQYDLILAAIEKRGGAGVSRSTLMQHYHLSSRDADYIFKTLEERSQIRRQKTGRSEMLYPIPQGVA